MLPPPISLLIHIIPKFNHFVNDFVFYKHKENEPILSTRFSLFHYLCYA